jgi:hypothetical protein
MEDVNPWHSNDEVEPVPWIATTQWAAVVLTWSAAGACGGTALGGLLQLIGQLDGGALLGGVSSLAGMGALGALALVAERRASERRPALIDARGRPSRPLHGALFAVPVMMAAPALLLMAMVGSVGLGGPGPAVAFVVSSAAVSWAGVRVWSTHRYTSALESLEGGAPDDARERLVALARSWLVTRSARTAARLNLGMMALHDGAGDEALDWYTGLRGGSTGAWAHAGRALALFMLNRTPEAGEELAEASGSPGARNLQEQLDALRVLFVWRTEGAAAARAVGLQLLSPTATPLHRALLVALGDRHWRDDAEVEALVHSGLGMALPELASVR